MEFRIKEICKEKGILIKDLAQMLGITDVGLRQSINGNPTIGTLEKIATALGGHDQLLGGYWFLHSLFFGSFIAYACLWL